MRSLLEQYGVGIATLVFMAILIAMASPFGIRIREYLLPQLEYASTIGSEEMAKATGGDTSNDDVAAMSSIYACLYTDGELVLSATPIDNTGRTDVDTDYGECELGDVNPSDSNTYPKWLSAYSFSNTDKITTVNFVNQVKPITCAYWFSCCGNLTEIKNIENLDTSECTNMSCMFESCTSLTTLDAMNFDTSNVTNMSGMFQHCILLTTLDVSNFDTSNVTDMSCMFFNCKSLTTLDVSNFNTSNVTDMSGMFCNCSSLTTLDVSNFNTSNVTDMSWMFFDINLYDNHNFFTGQTLPTIKNSENSWEILMKYFKENVFDMSNVTNTTAMFYWGIAS